MEILQGHQFRLEPNQRQKRLMQRTAGCCRLVYNKALAIEKERHKNDEKLLGYNKMAGELVSWKKDPKSLWLAKVPSQCLQQSLKQLDQGFKNFFGSLKKSNASEKSGKKSLDFEHPTFKKKYWSESFKFPSPTQFSLDQANKRVKFPKLGWMKYRGTLKVEGELRSITVSKDRVGNWDMSVLSKKAIQRPVHQGNDIGIDLGIARFATLSDGTFLEPLNSFRKNEEALRKAQQSFSRKTKGSKNREKARIKLARVHATIANTRNDYLHKASCTISKNHALVFMENLKVRNMSASAKGTLEDPGSNVAAKSGLNKSILDQGWYEFRRQVDYKLARRGGHLVLVDPKYTSQKCPECDHTSKENRLSQAAFECKSCGYANNADVVGALNIKRAGHARLACEVNCVSSQQQEPSEVDLDRSSG